jgi:SAM-dependent methyltransferase
VSRSLHPTAASGFSAAAAVYERGRPGYPARAISLLARELEIGPGRVVVDLAAGTGKLTRALMPLGAEVIAVEPVAEMRAELGRAVPGVRVLQGTAEALPFADGSVDVVLVAQAFHWFDAGAAAREIHRVVRPGGGLGVIWNAWDESVEWVGRMQAAIHAHSAGAPRHDTVDWRGAVESTGLFRSFTAATFENIARGDLDTLLTRVSSISYIAALDARRRELLLDDVRAIAPGGAELEMPYVTHVTWAHRAER